MQRVDSFEKTLMLEKTEGGRRRGRQMMRWLDGIIDSMDMGLDSGSWWWTMRPGMLQFMGSQRVGQDWATELNWTNIPGSREFFPFNWLAEGISENLLYIHTYIYIYIYIYIIVSYTHTSDILLDAPLLCYQLLLVTICSYFSSGYSALDLFSRCGNSSALIAGSDILLTFSFSWWPEVYNSKLPFDLTLYFGTGKSLTYCLITSSSI